MQSLRNLLQVRDNLEFTPLHKAAIRGNIAIVRALLRAAGRSFSMLNAKNRNGSTALILACAGGRKEVRRHEFPRLYMLSWCKLN